MTPSSETNLTRPGTGLSRFPTARDVFEAFPTAYDDIRTKPNDQPPGEFARSLAKGPKPEEALAFCAYFLPRREAVWWGTQCVRALLAGATEAEDAALKAAEAWVFQPYEDNRKTADRIGMTANRHTASTWLARAAAWSGGRFLCDGTGEGQRVPAHFTAQAVRTALMIALAGKRDRGEEVTQCVARGLMIAQC